MTNLRLKIILNMTLATIVSLCFASIAMAATPKNLEDQPGVRHMSAIPAAEVPAYITHAVDSPVRPTAQRELDKGRKPAQMLAFYGIKPGMKVADLFAGAGWSTELLSLTVGPKGKVYSQNVNIPQFHKTIVAWRARVKKLPNVTTVITTPDSPNLLPVKPGSLDVVWTNMNYHDLVGHKVDMAKFNATIYKDLKPGGIYALTDNSAPLGSGAKDTATIHRIDENLVIEQVTKAGFKLVASSDVLRNPKDDRTWLVFKHRGTQDRFMLKFEKPEHTAEASHGIHG